VPGCRAACSGEEWKAGNGAPAAAGAPRPGLADVPGTASLTGALPKRDDMAGPMSVPGQEEDR
jgi:hypothetical protein